MMTVDRFRRVVDMGLYTLILTTSPAMHSRCNSSPPTPPGRHKGLLTRAVSWLMISALLGMLVMPMSGVFASPADGVTLVTICTDHGTAQIALDAEGKSVPLEKQHHHGRACPFCLSHSGDAPLPAMAAQPALPADLGREIDGPVPAGIVPEPVFLTGRQTRAPPAPLV